MAPGEDDKDVHIPQIAELVAVGQACHLIIEGDDGVHLTHEKPLLHLQEAADLILQLPAGMGLIIGAQPGQHKVHHAAQLQKADADGGPPRVLHRPGTDHRLIAALQHGAPFPLEQLARVGEGHLGGAALEQAHADLPFQLGHLLADALLGHKQPCRRRREVQALGHL